MVNTLNTLNYNHPSFCRDGFLFELTFVHKEIAFKKFVN